MPDFQDVEAVIFIFILFFLSFFMYLYPYIIMSFAHLTNMLG